MRHRFIPFVLLVIATLACALPGSGGGVSTPALGAVQTEVAATLTAQSPSVVSATPAADVPTQTPVPPTVAAPTEILPCEIAIGYLTKLFCQNGSDQIQIADTSGVGPIQQIAISTDGSLVAYTAGQFEGTPQLWVVNGDGTNPRLLLDQTNLPPIQPDSVTFPRIFQWQANTHNLFFDTGFMPTAGIGGPGEYINQDLWKLDVDTNDLTQILSPGSGGYFSVSPDGQWLAVTRAQDVSLISTDGAVVKPNLISFPSVITYSEYFYKPAVTWSLDSTFFSVNIPSEDPLAADASATIHKVQADGTVTALKTLNGQFLFDGAVKISPDGQWVVYVTNSTDGSNQYTLHIEQTVGTGSQVTLLSGAPNVLAWSPDSQLFGVVIEGGGLQFSGPGAFGFELQPLAPNVEAVSQLVWSDAGNVIFAGAVGEDWRLRTAPITGAGHTDLAGPFGYEMVFAVR